MNPLLGRRSLILGGAGLAAAAVGLAACGSNSAPAAGPATSAAQASKVGSVGSAGAAGSAAGTTKAAGAIVKKADVPVGGGFIMTDGKFVVTQPAAGTYKAFDKICTHQGCPVSQVSGGTINCTCHGSKFSITDGSVTQGPARQPLKAATVTDSGDALTIA